MKTAIFSDFDGTISKRDVGYSLFHHFSNGKNDELLPDWKSGKMTTRDCLLAEAAMVNAPAEEILRFIDDIELDDHFTDLIAVCKKQDIPLKIVSDGLDFYIRHLFQKYGLSDLTFYANRAELINNQIKIHFDHQNTSCTRCGICKGELIRKFRESQNDPYHIIFIGDGYSDACGAKEADILFAKKDLKEYCINQKIDFISYNTFNDILTEMKQRDFIKG